MIEQCWPKETQTELTSIYETEHVQWHITLPPLQNVITRKA